MSGIDWLQLLWQGDIATNGLNGSVADAQEIVLNFRQSQYELRCIRLHVSVPASEILAEAVELHPVVGDDIFFASSNFRRTRFRIVLPRCKVTAADCLGLLQGRTYSANLVQVNDASFDILVNMDTPYNKNSSKPLMPNEGLSSIKRITQVNSINFINGRLKYAERYIIGSAPAVFTFDSIQLSAEGITNHADPSATAVLHAHAKFMKTSTLKLLMVIPDHFAENQVAILRLIWRNGPVQTQFLPSRLAKSLRIKSGSLQSVTFDISMIAGRSSGTVRRCTGDLYIATLNKRTGSERGCRQPDQVFYSQRDEDPRD